MYTELAALVEPVKKAIFFWYWQWCFWHVWIYFSRVPGERSSACSLRFKLSCAEPVGIAWTLLTSEDGAAGRSIAPWPLFGLHSVYDCHIKDQQISNGSNPGAILSASNCVKTKLAEAEIFKRLICKPETTGESAICCQCQRALIYSNSTHEIAWPVTGCGSSTFGHLGLEEFEEWRMLV